MKKSAWILCAMLCLTIGVHAQTFRKPDKSPMDMAYFPDHFAHDRKPGDKAIIRVTYSRPLKNGRDVFGKLVPYGQVWRTGANESNEIKFYQDVTLGGKTVKAGSYSLFSIPNETEWTIILNSDVDYWGAYKYIAEHDVLRVPAKVGTLSEPLENFSIQFESTGDKSGVMRLGWDKTYAEVPFSFN
ncbi:DUF2911 domain-containing protein [Chryseolinea sp. T2]|uniref:DUF2911 domain-containing protein n=1 Tax=Chryseolinea sp. T2 TaxID=3129255 RepID=UPI003077D0C8